jgi:hypothetical protein
MTQPNRHLPFDIDPRDPDFAREMFSWASETQSEICELLAATRQTLAVSRALMASADRILARK